VDSDLGPYLLRAVICYHMLWGEMLFIYASLQFVFRLALGRVVMRMSSLGLGRLPGLLDRNSDYRTALSFRLVAKQQQNLVQKLDDRCEFSLPWANNLLLDRESFDGCLPRTDRAKVGAGSEGKNRPGGDTAGACAALAVFFTRLCWSFSACLQA
jgi:hypothetical protein